MTHPTLLFTIVLMLVAFPGFANDHHKSSEDKDKQHIAYTSDTVQWLDGPASLGPGAQYATLEGDPSKPGVFTMRLKLPDGFTIAPHWHPNVERVTVLSGTFILGHGDSIASGATQTFTAGSYLSMPSGMRHFAIAEGKTVVQLTSEGPWDIHYVNEADDPRSQD